MRELIDRIGYRPRSCTWELTRACNLACQHCGSSAGRPREHELDTDECLRVVAELAALGTERLTLSGGEPTLRADWGRIARAATDAGIKVNLVSNGHAAPASFACAVRAAGLVNVALSLDGLEATHDQIRAPGSFATVTRLVGELGAAGIWVDVVFTVNRRNVAELEAVHALVGALGAKALRVQLGKPMGRQSGRDDLTLRARDLLTLMPLLERLAKAPGPLVRIGDSIGFYSAEDQLLRAPRKPWTGCYAGVQAVAIQADGSVKGCLSLQPRAGEADPFVEGNVRECSLAELWRRPGAFAFNRSFDPASLGGACARCSRALICRGGAKCVAYATTGSFAADPLCYLAASLAFGRPRRRSRQGAASVAASAVLMAVGLGGCGTEFKHGRPDGAGGTGSTATPTGTTSTATPTGTPTGTSSTATLTGTPTGAGGTGGAPSTGGSGGAAIDCAAVICESSATPAEILACCCDGVCCDCDYSGYSPPPECCP